MKNFSEQLNGFFFYLYFSNNFYARIMQMTAKSSVDSVRREMIAEVRNHEWRGVEARERVIQFALHEQLKDVAEVERIFAIIKQQSEY